MPPRRPKGEIPFTKTDTSKLDVTAAVKQAKLLRGRLETARATVETARRTRLTPETAPPTKPGSGGDASPNPDVPVGTPVDRPPEAIQARADALVPFLLIRSYPGDIGARTNPGTMPTQRSPDVLVTETQANGPEELGRSQFQALYDAGAFRTFVDHRKRYDVWVHVWNLGRAPAHGVRIRAWCYDIAHTDPPGLFLGGREIDLGDRSSDTSHRVIRIGQFTPMISSATWIWATAETLQDVALGASNEARFRDRHSALTLVQESVFLMGGPFI